MAHETILSWTSVKEEANQIAEQILLLPRHDHYHIYGVPRGGIPAAQLVSAALDVKGFSNELVDAAVKADVIIDDIIDSGRTREKYEKQYPVPFFALIQKADLKEWIVFPWEKMCQETGPEDNIVRILEFIGEDPNREGLVYTPSRVVKSWKRLFGGYGVNPEELLRTTFTEGACDEMVVLKNIEFYSHCEHHIMPFFGKASIGYIPNKRVVGISKLARLLEVYSKRLQIQERLGQQITDTIMKVLEPIGCGCVLEAQHFCMTSRGVEKQNSIMVTSSMQGKFRDAVVRHEFLRFIGQ